MFRIMELASVKDLRWDFASCSKKEQSGNLCDWRRVGKVKEGQGTSLSSYSLPSWKLP